MASSWPMSQRLRGDFSGIYGVAISDWFMAGS
jgi:hypothetical protein